MNEAVQVSETTEQTGDTLLNPNNVQSQPETTQEAPIPLHDDSEQQDQLNLTTDEHEELERPEDWPGCCWSDAKLQRAAHKNESGKTQSSRG